MNTPKTPRKPKRWTPPTHWNRPGEQGTLYGIADTEVAAAYGRLIAYWWHVEEQMVYVLDDLIFGTTRDGYGPDLSARRIFRSIISQEARITCMKSLLETLPHNADKPKVFDEILDEFNELNATRNRIVHGIWNTDVRTGNVYLARATTEADFYSRRERIDTEYLEGLYNRMHALHALISSRNESPKP